MSGEQILLTVDMGKALISKAVAESAAVREAALNHTLVIISGTTNGYLAKCALDSLNLGGDFVMTGFRRGVNVPPGGKAPSGPFANTDVVIRKGEWLRDKTIFDIADELTQGDVIVKGANALQPDRKMAGIQIGHPKEGTISPILQAVMGRRVRLIIPIGLEKRVLGSIADLAALVNDPACTGPRLQIVTGDIITEIEAVHMLTGAQAQLIAAGGVAGAEGSVTLLVTGTDDQIHALKSIMSELHLGKDVTP